MDLEEGGEVAFVAAGVALEEKEGVALEAAVPFMMGNVTLLDYSFNCGQGNVRPSWFVSVL